MGNGCGHESQKFWRCKYLYALILFLAITIFSVIYKMKEVDNNIPISIREEDIPKPRVVFKLLPEEKYNSIFMSNGFWVGPRNYCECVKSEKTASYHLDTYIDKDQLAPLTERREKEFRDYQRRHSFETKDVLVAQPNTPLSYPIQGAEVMPLHTIVIPGLGFHGASTEEHKVILQAAFGGLNTLADAPEDVVLGRGEKELIINTSHVALLNHILQHVTYTSTKYMLDVVDLVSFRTGAHHVKFPVTIRQPPLPKLYDPGPDNNIRNLVTITTKTFFRYHKLRVLLKSIRQYYPDIKIIVADDSEHPEAIQEANVEQFIMPFAKGWFAGRNLAVSQVTTKYYLWVDDDFYFTEKTKIEELVNVLENTDLDMVGGSVNRSAYKFKVIVEEGEGSGCMHLRYGSYHPLEGFPHCVVASGVINFFLARTEETRRIAFDPKLQRVAHSEYFMDGLGSLRVGSCDHVDVGHQPRSPATDPKDRRMEQVYGKFRTNTQQEVQFKLALHYFKNRLKCYTKS